MTTFISYIILFAFFWYNTKKALFAILLAINSLLISIDFIIDKDYDKLTSVTCSILWALYTCLWIHVYTKIIDKSKNN